MEKKYLGCLVRSLAGHDRGEIFLVVAEEGRFVALTDGSGRSGGKPKRKNIRHLALLKNGYPAQITEKIRSGEVPGDDEVRRVIREYKKVLPSKQEEMNV